MRSLFLATIAALLLCSRAFAGIVITVENREFDSNPPSTEMSRLSIDGHKMRIDQKIVENVPNETSIFRGDQDRLLDIDHANKRYRVMDKQSMKEAAGQMSQAMKQMEAQMATMPPEQRKMLESMMKGRMPQQRPKRPVRPETEVKKTRSRDTIGGYPCLSYEVCRGGRKVREIWATDWRKVGVEKGSLDVFKDMARFQWEMFASMRDNPMVGAQEEPFSEYERIDGFPILTRDYQGSRVTEEVIFKSVKEKELDASIFDPPAGYTKDDGSSGRGNRKRR
jgi:hypothetical protein